MEFPHGHLPRPPRTCRLHSRLGAGFSTRMVTQTQNTLSHHLQQAERSGPRVALEPQVAISDRQDMRELVNMFFYPAPK